MLKHFVLGLFASATLTTLDVARAQCGTWDAHFTPLGLDAPAWSALSFDDGSGRALYIGGDFTRAGHVAAQRVARWDGSEWHALGEGLGWRANDLIDFEHALHAASGFAVQRWNGSSWEALGAEFNGNVLTLETFDDGNGPALYAGGAFSTNGGQTVRGIARWDGSDWQPLDTGVLAPAGGVVHDMCPHDDGSGPALYVGGVFNSAGAANSPGLVRWNGTSWSGVGAGTGPTYALAVHDFGDGALLVLGGQLAMGIATWNGTSYAQLGTGLTRPVYDIESFPGASGPELFAGGELAITGFNDQGVVRWTGTSWESLGGPGKLVYDLEVHDDGSGATLVGAGTFTGAQGTRIASWNGNVWSPLPDGLGISGLPLAFATFDDGSGPALFVGGNTTHHGGLPIPYLARWSGSAWSGLPAALDGHVQTLLVWDDGAGPALYAGGSFTHAGSELVNRIARWDGTQWTGFGSGIGVGGPTNVDVVAALEAFDDGSGPQLHAAGLFSVAGGVTAVGIARWDGSDWNALEIGINARARVLKSFDDGSGPGLFVGGDFTQAGSVPANRIARWDGSAWHALGTGAADGTVSALLVFDDGGGANLYAGGSFTSMGGVAAAGLARWDGTQWYAVPKPFATAPRLAAVDFGNGPELVAAGQIVNAYPLYRRSNGTWIQLGAVNSGISAIGVFDSLSDGTPDIYIAGAIHTVDTVTSVSIASLSGCVATAQTFCAGDGSAAACPCGNVGSTGHGCENSTLSGGALLSANGLASVSNDSLRLDCSGVPTNTTTLFVQATGQANGGIGSVLGDGLLCISGAVLRIGSPNADGETSSVGFGTGSQAISINGQIPQAGATRHYQARYRNVASYCTSATFNQSNGASIVWAP